MITISSAEGIRAPLSRAALDMLGQAVLRKMPVLKNGVEVSLVSMSEIKKLNKTYRGKNRSTDVLSFSFSHYDQSQVPEGFRLAGQMYLSPDVIRDQARRFKISGKAEFARMFVHGLLHCAGLDHMTESEARSMFTLQEKIVRDTLKKLSISSGEIPHTLNDSYFKEFFVFPQS